MRLGLTLLLGSPRAFLQDDQCARASLSWAVVARLGRVLVGHAGGSCAHVRDAREWAALLACGPHGGFSFPFSSELINVYSI